MTPKGGAIGRSRQRRWSGNGRRRWSGTTVSGTSTSGSGGAVLLPPPCPLSMGPTPPSPFPVFPRRDIATSCSSSPGHRLPAVSSPPSAHSSVTGFEISSKLVSNGSSQGRVSPSAFVGRSRCSGPSAGGGRQQAPGYNYSCKIIQQNFGRTASKITYPMLLKSWKNSRMLSIGLSKIKQVQQLFHPQVQPMMRSLLPLQLLVASLWYSQDQTMDRRVQLQEPAPWLFRTQAHQICSHSLLRRKHQFWAAYLITRTRLAAVANQLSSLVGIMAFQHQLLLPFFRLQVLRVLALPTPTLFSANPQPILTESPCAV